MKPLAISADDYGIAPATSAEIRRLITLGRLSATSAMTVFPEWEGEGRALAPLGEVADLGLHFVLTDHTPLTAMPHLAPEGRLPAFPDLLRRAWAGRLHAPELEAELHAQLDAFEAAVGRPVDHLDGHHHVQQLPIVRDVVVRVARERLGARAWVRTCAEPLTAIVRRRAAVPKAIALSQAAGPLARALAAAGVPQPRGFVGAHAFDGPYLDKLQRFLRHTRGGTVLMVHPGRADDVLAARDSLVEGRAREADVLGSEALPGLLARAGVRLVRLRDAL